MRTSFTRGMIAAAVIATAFGRGGPAAAETPDARTLELAQGKPRASATIFLSGHSLMDNPLAENIEAIAKSLGLGARWNQQIVLGSPIRYRTRGKNTDDATSLEGYTYGKGRAEQPIGNVLEELKTGRTVGGARYDTLLITEGISSINKIRWEDTPRFLRHYHDSLVAQNAAATTYFYQPWEQLFDWANPKSWVAIERASTKIWQCVVTRINVSLAEEKRSDRVISMPAGGALAELIDNIVGEQAEGFGGGTVSQRVGRVFHDDVHLTRVGIYYMALVSFAAIYRRSPETTWFPPGVTAEQARALQRIAGAYVSGFYASYAPLSLTECRALLRHSFCDAWNAYVKGGKIPYCVEAFTATTWKQNDWRNPFFFDKDADKTYWLPTP